MTKLMIREGICSIDNWQYNVVTNKSKTRDREKEGERKEIRGDVYNPFPFYINLMFRDIWTDGFHVRPLTVKSSQL